METSISPAAQAVLDAYGKATGVYDDVLPDERRGLVAVLLAVADQVVPEAAVAVGDQHDEARLDQWLRIRWKLLAIAAELEGSTSTGSTH